MRGVRVAVALLAALVAACGDKTTAPDHHRQRDTSRDSGCAEAGKPHAYFYAAENRTDYTPDDPLKDGCALLVADHLFCCPAATKPTDR